MDVTRLFLVGFFSFLLLFQVVTFGGTSYAFALIPDWVKQNADWWSQGIVTDKEFASSLGFLVKENIIQVDGVEVDSNGSIEINDDIEIPSWIKNNAKWWTDGAISDTDFESGVEFMLTKNIISFKEKPLTPDFGFFPAGLDPGYNPPPFTAEEAKLVYEIQKWNEASLRWLLEIDNFEEKQLDKESKEKWQEYSVLKNLDIMQQAKDLEEEYRNSIEQTKSTLGNLKKIQELAKQAEEMAVNNGASKLDLEKSTEQQKKEIEQIKKITTDKELKNAKDKSEKATKQAIVTLDAQLAILGYPNEKLGDWLDITIKNPDQIDSFDDLQPVIVDKSKDFKDPRCLGLPGLDCSVHVVKKSGHSEKSCLSKNESSKLFFSWVLADEYDDKIETPHRLNYVVTKDNVIFFDIRDSLERDDSFGRINVEENPQYKVFPQFADISNSASSSILVKEPGLYAFSIVLIHFSNIYEVKSLKGDIGPVNIYSTIDEDILKQFVSITKKISGPVYSYSGGPETITITVPACSGITDEKPPPKPEPPIEEDPKDLDRASEDIQEYFVGVGVIQSSANHDVTISEKTFSLEKSEWFDEHKISLHWKLVKDGKAFDYPEDVKVWMDDGAAAEYITSTEYLDEQGNLNLDQFAYGDGGRTISFRLSYKDLGTSQNIFISGSEIQVVIPPS